MNNREKGQSGSKELRKLNRRELLSMLLTQCRETERLQRENDEMKAELLELHESYERLKVKLNVKDERLNQKDTIIAKLKNMIREMRTSRTIELTEAGDIAQAALRLNGIFEAAQRSAEQYLQNVRRLSENARIEPVEVPAQEVEDVNYTASGDNYE